MSVQADDARAKVVHCEVLDNKQKAKMLLLINTKPDTTMPVFTGVPDFLLGHTLSLHLEGLTAGSAPDGSVAFCEELLAKLDTLPADAQAVGHLFKQGRLPVPYGNAEALEDMIKELVVGSSGKLAEFYNNKIRNDGLLDATGKIAEVTGSLMLSLIIETWTTLQQFLSPERFVAFDYYKNKRVSATDPPVQLAWTPDTLDNGCFTFGSNVFQIGAMLSALREGLLTHNRQDLPLDAIDLIQVLICKVPANEALQHAWLCS